MIQPMARTLKARVAGVLAALAAVWLASAAIASAQSLQLARFPNSSTSFSSPYFVTSPPGDTSRVFVVEGAGRIQLVKNGGAPTQFLDVSSQVRFAGCGECGMFSIAFAPDYATSGLFYVFYTREDDAGVTPGHYLRVDQFQRSANPDVADPATQRQVLQIDHLEAGNHNGGQLEFGPDGYLYISTGDGGGGDDQFKNAQNTGTLLGKLLRIDPRQNGANPYSVPSDNPFVGVAGADEIYSLGLRNPYRFSFDRLTGDLTIGDVGQNAWEEVDFRSNGTGRGANFGWPCFEGNHPYSADATKGCAPPPANAIAPVLEYANAHPAAVNGGYVIRDGALPSWLGRYVYADTYNSLGGQLYSAVLSQGSASGNASTGRSATNVVSFGEDACGHVYVAEIGGPVYRIQPTSGAFPCAPQTSLAASPPGDKRAPVLTVDKKKARRAADAGEVGLTVSCDEACTVSASGLIVTGKGKLGIARAAKRSSISLRPDGITLAALAPGELQLDLSKKGKRKLGRALRSGKRGIAVISLTATDNAGNGVSQEVSARQKR